MWGFGDNVLNLENRECKRFEVERVYSVVER